MQGLIVLVDTHSVPPSQHGVIMFFEGPEEDIRKAFAQTVRKQFHLSLGDGLFTSNHALTVLVNDATKIRSSGIFQQGFANKPLDDNADGDGFGGVDSRAENYTSMDLEPECLIEEFESENRSIVLRPHQQEAVQKIVHLMQDCVMVWATGSGKTFTTLHMITLFARSSVIIVPTICLLLDIKRHLEYAGTSSLSFCSSKEESLEDMVRNALEKKTKVTRSHPSCYNCISNRRGYTDYC